MGCSRHPNGDLLDCTGTCQVPWVNAWLIATHSLYRETCLRETERPFTYRLTPAGLPKAKVPVPSRHLGTGLGLEGQGGRQSKGILTALLIQAMFPPPFRSEGAGWGLPLLPKHGQKDQEKNGTRDAEARSRQAPIWAPISGQYVIQKHSQMCLAVAGGDI